MSLQTEKVVSTLNNLLNQTARIRKGTDAVYHCPVCNHYKRKLEINLLTGKYNCWVCGFSGVTFKSLLKKLQAGKEYYEILCNIKVKNTFSKEDKKILTLPESFKPLIKPSNDIEYKNALNYCLSRGITGYDIARYNIGYCDDGVFRNRVIIPSYDENGSLNFYSGRDYYNSKMKYRLCDSTKNVIGFELLINFNEPITLVEGPFDAFAVKYNVIPLFGKLLSEKLKIKILETKPPRINVLLDNDAIKESIKMCEFLYKNSINTYFINLDGKDPNEIGHEKTWQNIYSGVKIDESTIFRLKLSNKI